MKFAPSQAVTRSLISTRTRVNTNAAPQNSRAARPSRNRRFEIPQRGSRKSRILALPSALASLANAVRNNTTALDRRKIRAMDIFDLIAVRKGERDSAVLRALSGP